VYTTSLAAAGAAATAAKIPAVNKIFSFMSSILLRVS
jgi:hypothetical protein